MLILVTKTIKVNNYLLYIRGTLDVINNNNIKYYHSYSKG